MVLGVVALAWEGERPADYRAFGAVLAVSVAVMFGLRDNVSRAVIQDVSTDALAQATGVMLGATIVLLPNLLCQARRPRGLDIASHEQDFDTSRQ